MRVISIGSDRGLFKEGTAVGKRACAYALALGELHIIVFSLRSHGLSKKTLGANVYLYPTNSSSKLFYMRDAARMASGIANADVVTTQDPFESGIAGLKIAKQKNIPLHVQIHTDFLSPEFAKSSFLNWIRVKLARRVLMGASRIRVVSKRIKDGLEKIYRPSAPISVLPIYIDAEYFKNAVAPNELRARFSTYSKRLLVVSRLEKEKNVLLALTSFAAGAPSDSCLIILGEGSEKNILQAKADSLGITSRVFFEGVMDPAPYYKLADLVLVTSFYEGYGLTTIEALTAGVPVLSTDVGIAKEMHAEIASPAEYRKTLTSILTSKVTAEPVSNPYATFDGYIEAYCADLKKVAFFPLNSEETF